MTKPCRAGTSRWKIAPILAGAARGPRRLVAGLSLLAMLAGAMPAHAGARRAAEPAARPNFLIIVADDLGYSDIGAFGGEIATPNLDSLAAQGMRLTGFHTAPTCSPTRAMLLSGLDNHEAGLGAMAENTAPSQRGRPGYEGYLRPDAATLAEMLGAAGYRTLLSGKWHLGLAPEQDPSRRGFQSSFSLLQASHNHFGLQVSADPRKGFTYRENGRPLTELPADFYSSDYFAGKLIEQIKAGGGGGGARPFFAYLAFTAPHFPLQAPRETIAKYRGRYAAGYEDLLRRRVARQVELGLIAPATVPHGLDKAPAWSALTPEQQASSSARMEVHAAMVDRMDQNVGRVLRALRETDELDNTIILFLSDNGADGMILATQMPGSGVRTRYDAADNSLENLGAASSYDSIGPGWAEAISAPSWGFKGSQAEGGTRVVSVLTGPGIRAGLARTFTSVMDVVPTFLDLAGVAQPDGGHAVQPIRGLSWVPWLRGEAQAVYPPDSPVGAELHGGRSLRRGDWKLLDPGDGRWRLFDVVRDPGETQDLAAREPALTAALVGEWQRYAAGVGVVLPERPGAANPSATRP